MQNATKIAILTVITMLTALVLFTLQSKYEVEELRVVEAQDLPVVAGALDIGS